MGGRRLWIVAAAIVLLGAACSDSTPDPTLATGPTTTAVVVTTSSSTTTTTSTTTTSTTTTSTTQSPDARFAEIQRLAQRAFVGRLKAIYDKDKESLLQWVGAQQTYDAAVRAIDNDSVDFIAEPTNDTVTLTLEEILLDRPDCVAGRVSIEASQVIGAEVIPSIDIWFPGDDGSLLLGAQWQPTTPVQILVEQCDLVVREINR